jgi:hypothetical protein
MSRIGEVHVRRRLGLEGDYEAHIFDEERISFISRTGIRYMRFYGSPSRSWACTAADDATRCVSNFEARLFVRGSGKPWVTL